jgi:PQQ-like domain
MAGTRHRWSSGPLLGALLVAVIMATTPATAVPSPPSGGTELWYSLYKGGGPKAIATSPDSSRVFVAGTKVGYFAVAYDAESGATLWVAEQGGFASYANGLAIAPDGSTVFVTGQITGAGGHWDYLTIAYDAPTGSILWTRRYDDPGHGNDVAYSVSASPDGSKVFVVGSSGRSGGSSPDDFFTIAYESSTGATIWGRRFDGPKGPYRAPSGAVSADGSRLFVVGASYGGPLEQYDYQTIAYDASAGTLLWARRYDRNHLDDRATSVATAPDGSTVLVSGTSGGDLVTVAYDASSGGARWVGRHPGGAPTVRPVLVTASLDGSTVFVGGSSYAAATGFDYTTIAYEAASGAVRWVRRYDGPSSEDDYVHAISASADGSVVFVTGMSRGGASNYDFATFAYRAATGAVMWAARYTRPGDEVDDGRAIASSPDGSKVFVTGAAGGAFTIAYEA